VPTATPWSVAPKLPGATSWGDIINGIDCRTSGGDLHCLTPGGRRFAVPAKGLPDGIRIAPGEPYYHYYSTLDGPVRFDSQALTQGMVNRPTPGREDVVRPATPEGTLNEATPRINLQSPFSPVLSYLTTDQNGTPVVVNVTQPGHWLHPGVVMRYVTTSPSGSTIQNEGAGLAPIQAPGRFLGDHLNRAWRGLSQDIVQEAQRRRDRSPSAQ
jgi:hypothetical protein